MCFGVRLTQLLLAWLFPTQASRRLWRAAARCSQVPPSFEFSQPRAVSPVRRWGTSSCQELHWKPDGYVISATATAGQLLYLDTRYAGCALLYLDDCTTYLNDIARL
jgi:hypothetical protein